MEWLQSFFELLQFKCSVRTPVFYDPPLVIDIRWQTMQGTRVIMVAFRGDKTGLLTGRQLTLSAFGNSKPKWQQTDVLTLSSNKDCVAVFTPPLKVLNSTSFFKLSIE